MQSKIENINRYSKGDKITSNIDGKVRGGEIIEIIDGKRVLAEFYTPPRVERLLEFKEFVLSEKYVRGDL